MSNRFFTSLFILCVLSFNVTAKNSDDPFAKSKSLIIGKDVSWDIDKKDSSATKSASDGSGSYYHLTFDNKQIELLISSDANGENLKKFTHLEVKNLKIDGKQSPLFSWCLKNQQSHHRFLQQGLSVKKNICEVDGDAGRFVMRLNRDTLTALQKGQSLSIVLKPFRTPLELNYDLSDFQEMHLSLNAQNRPKAIGVETNTAVTPSMTKCWAKPPEKYKNISSIEYPCADSAAKRDAEVWVSKQVDEKKDNERKLAAQRAADSEKQRKIAEDKRLKDQAAKLEQEKLLQAEAAAVAASEVKQAEINSEITQKMISMCDKYWSKGEHRCYCQKYIEHAPSEIQQSSTCN